MVGVVGAVVEEMRLLKDVAVIFEVDMVNLATFNVGWFLVELSEASLFQIP